jgi:gamma-glutamyltranspeptidase / glutathione hydrolase
MTFTTRPVLQGTFGMVAATHWLAAGSGMRMFELGGNAFDAAAAAGFVLQVVEPHQNGPGGDLPVVFWNGTAQVLCAQGPAPADVSRLAELDLIPGGGLLPAVVPGAFDGWMQLVRDFGVLRLRDVLEPAIGYASEGFPVAAELAADVGRHAERFRSEWPSSAEVWLRGGGPRAGTPYALPGVAATYRRILEESARPDRDAEFDAARDAFYRGFVAEAVDQFSSSSGGVLRGEDLAGWSASYEPPVTFGYRGLTVCKPGSWSQGPVFLQQLALLDGFELEAMDATERVHTIVECSKLAFADREAWYGDPDFVDVSLGELLSVPYNEERRRLVGADAAFALRPGSPGGRAPLLFEPRGAAAGASSAPVGSDTCAVATADRFGNVVSATPSGGWLKSSPAIPELGFCLGTRGQMFWPDERLPGGIAPGKRPRTTLSPTLALRDGEPYLGFGTPGGDAQDQWSLQFFLAHVGGADLQAAMDAPRFTSYHAPS